jgi:hypothetical protein
MTVNTTSTDALDREVAKYARQGWTVVTRSETSAQLVRKTGPSLIVAIILLCCFVLPGILYLMFYRGQQGIYLSVDHFGKVKATRS